MKLSGWTREPLVHFLLAGLFIYFLFALMGKEADPTSRSIDVDRARQAQIALAYERMMGRAPTDAELDQLIEQYVREEVLYREALRLGLDRDDAVVRRRMAQKMDLIAAAQAEAAEPKEAELRRWYEAHIDRFSSEPAYSFRQIWFPDEASAASALAALREGRQPRLRGTIDLPQTATAMPAREVAARFGFAFLEALEKTAKPSIWAGPIPSGMGWHLVRIESRQPAQPVPFAQARKDVEDDWRSNSITERKQQAYEVLRQAYRVRVER